VTNDLWNQRVNQNERPQILNKDFTFLLLAGAVFFSCYEYTKSSLHTFTKPGVLLKEKQLKKATSLRAAH